MTAGITTGVGPEPKPDAKVGSIIRFVTKLKCDTPTALSQIVRAEAMINPCLVIDEDEKIDELDEEDASSDLTDEESLSIDEDLVDDPEVFSDEEFDEPEPSDHDIRDALNKGVPSEDLESALDEEEVRELLEATSESEAAHKEFQEELDNMSRHRDHPLSGIEPFFSIRRREHGFETQVSDLPGIAKLSLNEELKKIMKDKYKDALDLVTAVNTHREIIQKLANVLINRQQAFFSATDYQKASCALKPFSQTDMAKALGLHKSTIARIVQGKVVETDFGYVPLQALFGRGEGPVPSRVKLQIVKDFIAKTEMMPTDPDIQAFFDAKGIKMSLEMIRYYRKRLGINKKRGRKS